MSDLDILTRWTERCSTSRNRVIRDAPWTLRTAKTVDETVDYLRRHIADASRPIENPEIFKPEKLRQFKRTLIALAREADWLESEAKRG